MRRAVYGTSAKGPMYHVAGVPPTSRGLSIPAPVGGWDAISPIAAMPETNAIVLDNIFPRPGYVEIRKGHRLHETVAATAPVESLMPFHALDGSDSMWAGAGTGLFNVTTDVTATNSAIVGGFANVRFQHVNIATSGGDFLWVCNGADDPMKYDGTTWTTASITGVTPTDIANCAVFKGRIFLALKDAISAAYLNNDSVQGTASPFDLVGVFQKGGFLQAIGTWSLDGGAGPDDHIAFITSRGEVAIYSGTDPNTNFILKGVYEIGAPIGRRCVTKVGADLAIICIDGVVPLSKALITDRAAALTATITKMIQPVMNQSARDWGANFGWQLIGYPRGTRAILNVPVTENTEQRQYVMNTITGAWCRFTGENANCWAVFQDRLFYGGNAGQIYEADCQGFDEGGSFPFRVDTAFNYCGNRGRLKGFDMARALMTTDGQIAAGLALNVDFANDAVIDPITIEVDPESLWDVALWDQGVWPEIQKIVTDWVSVAGEGYAASIAMAGVVDSAAVDDPSRSIILNINGWDLLVQDGGFM